MTARRLPLLLLVLLALPPATFAHRLDEYLQATLVVIEPGEIRLQINLTPGVDVAEKVLGQVDQNHDGVISKKEAADYADLVKDDLTVRLDDRKLELKVTASDFPAPAEIRTGSGVIQVEFSTKPSQLASGPHKLSLENRHLPSTSVYLLNAAKPKSGSIQITAQKRSGNQSAGDIEFTVE